MQRDHDYNARVSFASSKWKQTNKNTTVKRGSTLWAYKEKTQEHKCNVRNEAAVYRMMGRSLQSKYLKKLLSGTSVSREPHKRLSEKTSMKISTGPTTASPYHPCALQASL